MPQGSTIAALGPQAIRRCRLCDEPATSTSPDPRDADRQLLDPAGRAAGRGHPKHRGVSGADAVGWIYEQAGVPGMVQFLQLIGSVKNLGVFTPEPQSVTSSRRTMTFMRSSRRLPLSLRPTIFDPDPQVFNTPLATRSRTSLSFKRVPESGKDGHLIEVFSML